MMYYITLSYYVFSRNLAVMGSMDRNVFLVDLRKEDNPVISTFGVHKKYVSPRSMNVQIDAHTYFMGNNSTV